MTSEKGKDSRLVKKEDTLKFSSEKKVFIVFNQTLSWQEFIMQFFLIITEISQIGCKLQCDCFQQQVALE